MNLISFTQWNLDRNASNGSLDGEYKIPHRKNMTSVPWTEVHLLPALSPIPDASAQDDAEIMTDEDVPTSALVRAGQTASAELQALHRQEELMTQQFQDTMRRNIFAQQAADHRVSHMRDAAEASL